MALNLVVCSLMGLLSMDWADPVYRDVWFRHPAFGDPSYDSFVRHPGNPIYQGTPPYEWPVNGSLFKDPKTGNLYCYVSMYPKGYWPAGPTRLLRAACEDARPPSRDVERWEDLGLILQGDKDAFDGDGARAGATCDATVVADRDGYHMAYGWAKPDNHDGGIAHAFAPSPEGPWQRDPTPIHAESAQPIIAPGYKRVYASSLIRRAHDWLILASMSTPGNAGGIWAFIAMTAPEAGGPYTAPIFIRAPQEGSWQPQPVEFFPAFVHDGHVYAPLTSIAANRGYQVVYRAPIEDAHRPEAWDVWQAGSLFHAEDRPSEAHGIWGQAFAGLVDNGLFRVMYPSRNADGIGTINLASRPWDQPFQKGFWISAPNAPAWALALRDYREFRLDATFRTRGAWRLTWNCRGLLGPDRSHADASISPLAWRDMTMLAVHEGTWSLQEIGPDGVERTHGAGSLGAHTDDYAVGVAQTEGEVRVRLNGTDLATAQLSRSGGGLGLIAEAGSCLHVSRFEVTGDGAPGWWYLLPLEGLLGAGNREKDWSEQESGFRYCTGYVGVFDGARAKWCFEGSAVRLWAPRGPDFGEAEVFLDGRSVKRLDFRADAPEPSSVVWEAGDVPRGPHAVLLVRRTAGLPVDGVEFSP